MTLKERLREYVRACCTAIWIESHEHEDALLEIAGLCTEEDWRLATWDIERGLVAGPASAAGEANSAPDPLAAIRALGSLVSPDGKAALLVLSNFHRFIDSAEIVQALLPTDTGRAELLHQALRHAQRTVKAAAGDVAAISHARQHAEHVICSFFAGAMGWSIQVRWEGDGEMSADQH